MDSENELFILYFHHRGRGGSRATLSTTVELWTQGAPHKWSPKAHSLKKQTNNERRYGSRVQVLRSSRSRANRNAAAAVNVVTLGNGEHRGFWMMSFKIKKKKSFTQTVTVLKGPKGINNRNAAFIFSLIFRGELGVEEMDGWMLSFSISIYRRLRCCVMLLRRKRNPLYIYIYKLKIITLMQ